MQAAGHVRRRHHDRVGRLAAVRVGGKGAGPLPTPRIDAPPRRGLISLVQHRRIPRWHQVRLFAERCRGSGLSAAPPHRRRGAISSRTSRSTMPGRCSLSQVWSNGRSMSRTMSSSVRSTPPSGSSGLTAPLARQCAELGERGRRGSGGRRRDDALAAGAESSARSRIGAATAAARFDAVASASAMRSALGHTRWCGCISGHGDDLGARSHPRSTTRSVRECRSSPFGGSLARRCGRNASLCSGSCLRR